MVHFRYYRVRHTVAACCSIDAHNGDTFGFGVFPSLSLRIWKRTATMLANDANGLFFHMMGASSGVLSIPLSQSVGR
jgi:hypothetical protein